MDVIAPDDDRLAWEGVAALVRDGDWWQPWRLPPDRLPTAHAPELDRHARMPAGARIALETDATGIVISLEGDVESSPLDVLVDGEHTHRLAVAQGYNHVDVTIQPGPKHVEIWLPQFGETRVGNLAFSGHSRVAPWRRERPRWTTYGSSITHCRAADGPCETWPALVSRRHDWDLTCLGFGGECHLDPVVARTIRDTPADIVSLCLGINIYGRGSFHERSLASAVSGFIETIREGKPQTPIVVITPIISPEREETPNLVGMTLSEVRGHVATAAGTLMRLGDPNLFLVDGREVLGEEDTELLFDGLHPSADGYRLMADRLAPKLERAFLGARR